MFVIIQLAARGVQARKAMAPPIPGQLFHGVKDGVHWEFKWGLGPAEQHPNRSADGDAGWADVMCRSCGTMPDLRRVRVHLCATGPCTVVRPAWM